MQVADPLYKRYAVTPRGSHCLYAHGFRFCFTPLPGFFSPFPHGTGPLSVDYECLALEDGPPIFRQDSSCPVLLSAGLVLWSGFRVRGCHPLPPPFPGCSTISLYYLLQAPPGSLATTSGISVDFFSSGYLDVSVRRVRSTTLCVQVVMAPRAGFPHSDIHGSGSVCRLPVAFRRLPRPSSPVIAKASTMCTCSLVSMTLASTAVETCRAYEFALPYSKIIVVS